jgi:hypothetical protein
MNVDDLLLDGTVTQDPENPDKVIFNVPVYILKSAVNAGGFEMFAGSMGWQPDAAGATPEDIAANNIFKRCRAEVGRWITGVIGTAVTRRIQEAGRVQIEQTLAALLGK